MLSSSVATNINNNLNGSFPASEGFLRGFVALSVLKGLKFLPSCNCLTDKANALRRATLERRTAEDDIQDPWIEVSPRKTIPFPHEISLEEAQDATLRTGNTSPGADNITVKLLTAVWHIIGTHVRRLFEGCLAIGHHPKPFRAAEVVMIAKPGRRDLTNPRAWRPISLLSCLGKGLER
ncbi:hypothetical protein FOXB_17306, partial [Fusarium oxysporum f. sp. conglutinans Fo5176]